MSKVYVCVHANVAFCSKDWLVTWPDIICFLLIYIVLFQSKLACLLHLLSLFEITYFIYILIKFSPLVCPCY